MRTLYRLLATAVVGLAAFRPAPAQGIGGAYEVDGSSFLGGSATDDAVHGTVIQADGTVVLAANIGNATPGGLTPVLLNGATASSGGAIVRLAGDGRTVLSVTRLAARVVDLALDAAGNIYVAAWEQGIVKLDPNASTVLWQQNYAGQNVWRVDAGPSGHRAALAHPSAATDLDGATMGAGTIRVYDAGGVLQGTFAGHETGWNTMDIALDEASQTLVNVGWRQTSAWDGNRQEPVQISFVRGRTYTGGIKYAAYDWSTDPASDRFLNRSNNNMADTRALRACIGADGKLYVAFLAAGGNHIFRYSPYDIMEPSPIVGGDSYHQFHNSQAEHKTFFGRYEPATGEYVLGQQFCGRLPDGRANTAEPHAIWADAQGRVYIGGVAASGLPLSWLPPNTGPYTGGAWLLVMSPDFTQRLLCTRIASTTGSKTRSIHARPVAFADRIAHGGGTSQATETYLSNPVQGAMATANDGFFTVLHADLPNVAPSCALSAPAEGALYDGPSETILLNATASDSDGSVVSVAFYVGGTLLFEDSEAPYSHSWQGVGEGEYTLTAVATDNDGATTVSAPVNVRVRGTTPPAVLAFSPADNATGVSVASTLTATFDESLLKGAAGSVVVHNLTDGTQQAFAVTGPEVTVAGRTLNLDPPGDLLGGKSYAVTVDAGAVTDLDGNPFAGIAATTVWNFQTDGTVPAVTALLPADNSSGVGGYVDLRATFNTPVRKGAGSITVLNLTDGTEAETLDVADSRVAVYGTTVVVDPGDELPGGKALAVRVSAGALVADSSGIGFAGIANDTTWNFGTASGVPASRVFLDPFVGAAGEALNEYDTDYALTFYSATLEEGEVRIGDVGTGAYVALREDQSTGDGKAVHAQNIADVLPNTIGYSGPMYLAVRVHLAAADFDSSTVGTYAMMRIADAGPSYGEDVYLWFDKDAGSLKASVGTSSNPTPRSGPLADGEHVIVVKYTARAGTGPTNAYARLAYAINPQSDADFIALGNAGGYQIGFAGAARVDYVQVGAAGGTWIQGVGRARSTFDNVCVASTLHEALAGVKPRFRPNCTLTAPTAGATFADPATVQIAATASDPDGSVSSVDFYSGPTLLHTDTTSPYEFEWSGVPTGYYYISAVATDNEGLQTASAAVEIAVGDPNALPTCVLISPMDGLIDESPASIPIEAAASDSDGSVVSVAFFANTSLLHTDATAPYQFAWSGVPVGSYNLTAVATDNRGAQTTSTPVLVTVEPPNVAPSCTLTAPADGATFGDPAHVTLQASASDSDGTVASVSFYNGATLLGTDTEAPYEHSWEGVGAGLYALTAVATDNDGASTASSPVEITVGNPNNPPSCALTSPTSGSNFTAPASVVLQAAASDSDGEVTSVAFYNGTTLLHTDTGAPFSFTWNSVPAGNYSLTAVATDDDGATTTSSTVAISVQTASWVFRDLFGGTAGQPLNVYDPSYSIVVNPNNGTLEEAKAEIAADGGGAYLAVRENQSTNNAKDVYALNSADVGANTIGYAGVMYFAARVRIAAADFSSNSTGIYAMMRVNNAAPSYADEVYLWLDKDAGSVKASVGTGANPTPRSGPLADGEHLLVVKYVARAGSTFPNTYARLYFGLNPQTDADLTDLGNAGGYKTGYSGSSSVSSVRVGANGGFWLSGQGYARGVFEGVGIASTLQNALAAAGASPLVAPTGLSAAAASSTRVDLSWIDGSANETGFLIERKTGVGGNWTLLATATANVTTHADNSVAPGTQYSYRVRATNATHSSYDSNEASSTTPSDFDAWKAARGMAPGDDPSLDHDGNGAPELFDYLFANDLFPGAMPHSPSVRVVIGTPVNGDDRYLEIEFRRRKPHGGVEYRARSSENLVAWGTPAGLQEVVLDTSDPEFDLVALRIPAAAAQRLFGRIDVFPEATP